MEFPIHLQRVPKKGPKQYPGGEEKKNVIKIISVLTVLHQDVDVLCMDSVSNYFTSPPFRFKVLSLSIAFSSHL